MAERPPDPKVPTLTLLAKVNEDLSHFNGHHAAIRRIARAVEELQALIPPEVPADHPYLVVPPSQGGA